ncbi:DUF427 domain-containing protein [Saliniramus sp.]|uniref:DUF427 domain-containing protein n=1 Tax=Saliniramus sp. TaxID=2986772 RepID=UPI002B88A112|nr:DUF427 domain-containing protein [Saliniramus sp.]HMB09093.1 DUF427 domain-containing protein [Saliniramus sp.]
MTELRRENVQSYPRPPALEPVALPILIRLRGQIVARSESTWRVLETHHAPTYYIPPQDVQATLRPASRSSYCEWKGAARYFDVIVDGAVAQRAAWCYDNPSGHFAPLAGYLAFYAGQMDECRVGDVVVIPQPGDFYGGWVTPNLDGIVKGGPGTRGW